MRLVKAHRFNPVKAYELGWSLFGPPLMTTHFYVIGDVMVDTGQSHMRKEALKIASVHRIERIYLTHYHEDHSGNTAAIVKNLDAMVCGHPGTAEMMAAPFNIFFYQKYMWGKAEPVKVETVPDIIETELGLMEPVHTPGHAEDHICYFLKDEGILFSGDLYLGDKIKYFRSDEDMGSQIQSLNKVLSLDFDALLCGHAPKQKNGKKHIRNKLNFLNDLYGNIIRLWEKGIPEKRILSILNLKEEYFIQSFCMGDVSMINGIRSAVRHHTSKTVRTI